VVIEVAPAPRSSSVPSVTAAAAPRSTSRLRALLARTDKAITLNIGLLALLTIWLLGELAIEGTAYTLVAIVPSAPFFARAAYAVHVDSDSKAWLSASGGVCALLFLLCAASFYDSLAMTPVDVTCAVTSAMFGAVFGVGACYQLLRSSRD
jgi:hypothetical protein